MTKEEFKKIRASLNMTQTQFAVALGFPERRQFISDIENGRMKVMPRTAITAKLLFEQKRGGV